LSEVGLKDRRIVRCQCNRAEEQGGETVRRKLSEVGLKDRRIIRCQCNSAKKQCGETGAETETMKKKQCE